MTRWGWGIVALLAVSLALVGAWGWHTAVHAPPAVVPSLDVARTLSAQVDPAFQHADRPRAFVFPDDHGPHPRFRTEWWYWTGNLRDAEAHRFGYQLTIFRVALAPQPVASTSAWATEQVYLAHAALTDVAAGRFRSQAQSERGAAGLAGAVATPFRVWVGRWQAAGWAPTRLHVEFSTSADAPAATLDLSLRAGGAPVLEGDGGWSHKGAGGSSYYYSLPRMPTTGTLTIGTSRHVVHGSSWMDREWSTSALSAAQSGWDWFALGFTDGRSLMLYRMRLKAGGTDPASAGTLILPDGTTRALTWDQIDLTPTGSWRSPRGGTYPAGWHLRVPSAGIDTRIQPVAADQELDVGVRYWEGAVDCSGPTTGEGYVELTGYGSLVPGS